MSYNLNEHEPEMPPPQHQALIDSLAEAEDLPAEFAIEMYMEVKQRSLELEAQRLSKEIGE